MLILFIFWFKSFIEPSFNSFIPSFILFNIISILLSPAHFGYVCFVSPSKICSKNFSIEHFISVISSLIESDFIKQIMLITIENKYRKKIIPKHIFLQLDFLQQQQQQQLQQKQLQHIIHPNPLIIVIIKKMIIGIIIWLE